MCARIPLSPPDAFGDPVPGNEEAWGLEIWPAFAERARMVGLVGVGYCWFDSRECFHNGHSFLLRPDGPLHDDSVWDDIFNGVNGANGANGVNDVIE